MFTEYSGPGRRMMETVTLGFSAVLLIGLAFGAGPCNLSCLPFLGPVFLAQDGGIRGSWRTVVPFSLGRMLGYTLLGAVAGGAGKVATTWFDNRAAAMVLGTVTIIVGLAVIWRVRKPSNMCSTSAPDQRVSVVEMRSAVGHTTSRTLPLGLFGMGAAMALNPCVPLGTVLMAAATAASPWAGGLLGFGFGVGAVLVPALFFGLLMAHFGAQIRQYLFRWRRGVEAGAGGMLILLGTVTAFGWVQV
jgi:sulfite exporter TauE/SafE